MITSPSLAPDLLDRLLDPACDAGLISFGRAAELVELAYGDPPLVRVVQVDGEDMLDLADIVAVAVASLPYLHEYAAPPLGEEAAG